MADQNTGSPQTNPASDANNPSNAQTDDNNKANNKKRNIAFPIILAVVVIVGGFFGIRAIIWGKHHTQTDDAQTQGDLAPIIPRTSGYVVKLNITDNQTVKKGDTLVVLDQRDLASRLEQAEAALDNAKANLDVIRANVKSSSVTTEAFRSNTLAVQAQIRAARIKAERAAQDFERYANLIKDHSITQQQYDQASADKETAAAQLVAVTNQRGQASSQASASQFQAKATAEQIKVAETQVKQRQADVDYAKLQLSYAAVVAPENGIVTKRNVQLGQYVQAGQSLFTLVLSDAIWVVANFKETQLEKMRVGQSADIEIDAFPKHPFKGKVQSISGATGAQTALLPADNATGNFVKVVQRVPVKVIIERGANDQDFSLLRQGMNTTVTVNYDESNK